MADKKTDNPRQIVLDDGRELTVDLRGLTWGEAEEMINFRVSRAEDLQAAQHRLAELLGKVVGLTADEVLVLSLVDFTKVNRQMDEFFRDLLGVDPN